VAIAPAEERGLRRLLTGAGLGLAGGIAAIALPLSFFWLSVYNPGGFFVLGPALERAIAVLLIAGAILFLFSLLYYRRAFSWLRRADPGFTTASVLSVVGSMGFLLLLLVAATLVGSTGSLIACARNTGPSVLSCVQRASPIGAYGGLLGFWLGWFGGVGLVLGLGHAGRRYREGSLGGAALLYALLLIGLVVPFVSFLVPVPGTKYLLLAIPVLTILAPALVFGAHLPGDRTDPDERAASAGSSAVASN
jgi:hypothetical protein